MEGERDGGIEEREGERREKGRGVKESEPLLW